MSEVIEPWRSQLAALTIPQFWAMSRWVHQNGSCYVTVLARGEFPATVDGWACLTFEDEPYPVVGVFVKEEKRGQGWAKDLVNSLLRIHRGSILAKGGKVYAAVDRFPYRELCREHGYECIPWE